jgi:Zn-dependent M28 family amino/carboxypeptidase
MPSVKLARKLVVAVLAAAAGLAFISIPANADPVASADLPDGPALARNLARKVTVGGINRHLIALQRFADQTDRTRAASTEGHKRSAEYIAQKLEDKGYIVTRQEFPFVFTKALKQSLMAGGTSVPIKVFTYSPNTPVGGITAPTAVLPAGHETGCAAADYNGVDVVGKIVLVKRGPAGCTFAIKASNAAAAGAVGTVVYNNVPGPFAGGTLSDPANGTIPVGGISDSDGASLAAQVPSPVTLELRSIVENRTSYNVIAETQTGRHDNVVMAGAHLDSVTEGPGINDNGSGSATLLETALQLASSGQPRVNNAVRFAWWSAEEFGLVGSTFYVDSLDFEEQLNIALYLNFDMIGSPNAGRFIYDGDGSDGLNDPGPFGSAQIEHAFADFFTATEVETEGTAFDGRSDYGEFITMGIPAGGLFTGAEKIKTEDQAAKWGGVAGMAYDSCYHQACDNLGNLDRTVLDSNADGIAFVLGTYAISTEDINGIPPGAAAAKVAASKKASAKARFLATVKTARLAGADGSGTREGSVS